MTAKAQLGLEFDAERAERAREEAIDRVERHARAAWLEAALGTVRQLAVERPTLTTDDVWLALGSAPREPRALGAVMRKAEGLELIEPTNQWALSTRVACHRRPLRVWRSRVYDPGRRTY